MVTISSALILDFRPARRKGAGIHVCPSRRILEKPESVPDGESIDLRRRSPLKPRAICTPKS
jgi:hypothetical protein